ncbi:MAG: AAA family ATPase [Denitromonas halophila]|nr:MAG: AAA family ATPase [Denitromonas halophila]
MAYERERLSRAETTDIYAQQIRPATLDRAQSVDAPKAIIVIGHPGAGADLVARESLRALGHQQTVLISTESLREHSPAWQGRAPGHTPPVKQTQPETDKWVDRLTKDAIEKRTNIVIDGTLSANEKVSETVQLLKSKGFQVEAILVSRDIESSRLLATAKYLSAREYDIAPRFFDEPAMQRAVSQSVAVATRFEAHKLVDKISVVDGDSLLYANQLRDGAWGKKPRAGELLEQRLTPVKTPNQLAIEVTRWDTLARHIKSDPLIPTETAKQISAWQMDSKTRTQNDPLAQRLAVRNEEANTFLHTPVSELGKVLPQYGKQIARLAAAQEVAQQTFKLASDRDSFVAAAKTKIANDIAQGKIAPSKGKEDLAR